MAWQMQMVETFHFLDAVVRIGYIGQTSADRRQLQHILMTQLAVCEFADLHSLNAWCRGGGGGVMVPEVSGIPRRSDSMKIVLITAVKRVSRSET